MAVDAALLAALESEIGVEHVESLGEISAVAIARYAAAIGDPNPLHSDREHARSRGHADLVAPANFVAAVINWSPGAPYERLREDGTEADSHLPGVPAKGVRVMGGGEQMTFHEPVVAGMVLTRTTVLGEVDQRSSSQGPMLVARYQDTYRDGAGTLLLESVRTVLLR
ncbi:MAG: MaoC family dehydratase N-terminal domain-containing protein [Solirubrobacteraceae bacterium]|jgi:acyl dehydratase